MQNGERTTIEHEKKSKGACIKERDNGKEGDTISQQKKLRKSRRKRTRISQVEKLQIAGVSYVSPTKFRATAGEQKMLRTKIAQHKLPKGNVGSGRVAEVVNGRRKQEGGALKNVSIFTDI